MRHGWIVGLLAGLLLALGTISAHGEVGCLLRALNDPHPRPAPKPSTSINRSRAVPPGHQPYYAYNVDGYPWLSGGLAVPTFQWGYFGARYRPLLTAEHDDYHGRYWQWKFRPGD